MALLLTQLHPKDFCTVVHSTTLIQPSYFIVGWISLKAKINGGVWIRSSHFGLAIGWFCCAAGEIGVHMSTCKFSCSRLKWGKCVRFAKYLDCFWHKKLNSFPSTQWVKYEIILFLVALGNFYFSSLLMRKGLVLVFVVFSNFRECNVTISHRHSK